MKGNRFERRSGCYACRVCTRMTRSTGRGDNENVGLCVECFEVAGIENEVMDGHYRNDEELAGMHAEIAALNAACVLKGGKLAAPKGGIA